MKPEVRDRGENDFGELSPFAPRTDALSRSERRLCISRVPRPRVRVTAACILLVLSVLTASWGSSESSTATDNTRLECTPRTFDVVPGQPMRLELTVQSDSAAPIRLQIPGDRRLKLRALEKLPVRRTAEGVIVHKRIVVWQGLEPGTITMKALSVETQGRKLLFPEVTITVRDPGP